MKKILYIIILLTGYIIKSPGQEAASVMVLSLKDAIDYAVNYNKSLSNARLEVEKSKHNFWEAVSQGLPKVDGTLDYMTYFNYELRFEFGMPSDFEFSSDQLAQARDLTLAAFPGVTEQDLYRHTAGNFFDNTLSAMLPPSTILMSDQSTARLQLSQLIFSGQYIVGIQTAKLAKKISEQNVEFSELDVKEAVINAYYLVLITEESLNILEQNLKNLNEVLEQTRKMYATGMAEKTDVDQLRITVNQLENSRNSVRRNLELTKNMLRFQLGLEMDA
ncbi:MAG TPA: hypothetical protein ENN61_01200, partial [Bacteroidaceae bacterium]|nr:hypothetical protein [Bacteroidaceae bacterium]